ncbi:HelD family protein [Rugosimonospora africana]|uniref:DNA helicase n=1 Tax=Rugosimonospora africana TaxID=556532 RepID=A0A8J3VNV9_9ACTN|nr:AAA family ATPase [Rugosimonospora africana]GIH13435.1 DNA helicase [Rugosimonospora africana]
MPEAISELTVQLDEESAHLTSSRAALRRMREHAQALYATGGDVAGDAYGAESLGRALSRRVAELADDPTTPLFFGRLWFAGEADYHIGRRHVTDDRGEPLVLDWRAPISRSFYRASASDPQGVAVRRRFGFSAGILTSFEDEHLDRGEELGTSSRILTNEIERPRVGPMRDIVATIQPDQDELVRADIEETICVQGAPGTGKTAVGLHRAAFLLYLHRERLRRSSVLIVGPNRAFLRYIAAVLPALGEIDVAQSTVEDLLPTAVRGSDPPEAQLVKHDPRMAAVLHRALRRYVRRPQEPIVVSDGAYKWRLPESVLVRLVDDVRREKPPHGIGRERLRARVVALLQRQVEARSGESPGEGWVRKMGRSAPVVAFLDANWPAVTPEALVYEVLRDPADAAEGILTEAEQTAIRWAKPPRSPKAARWSAADAVLIDEAAGLIDRLPSFGHVVIDEAQDLSPMQCRVIARRSEHASLTLLGDLAQGTAPWAARDWADSLEHLGKPGAAVVPLTTGFRVPQAVVQLANRLLPALGVNVSAATSLRGDGWLRVQDVSDVDAATVGAVREALEQDGSVAVIAAEPSIDGLAATLRADGLDVGTAEDEKRITVLPATLAKGLEYDHVIVVEPAEIVAAEARGLNRLYVVLTRAVSRLAVIHARPLPEPL